MKYRSNKKKRLVQKTVQKTSLRKIVAFGSALAIIASTFVYLNFSQSSDSKASGKEIASKPNFQTTDMVVPVRMLKDVAEINRSMQNNYKNSINQSKPNISRVKVIPVNNAE